MSEKLLFLVRHGETDLNKVHLIQGSTDEPINQIGIMQAHDIAKRFEENGIVFDDAYSSPLQRAVQTLKIITKIPHQEMYDLRERGFGQYEKRPVSTVPKLPFGDYFVAYGGESDKQVFSRMNKVLNEIMDNTIGKTVLVVGHGSAIRNVLAGWEGKPESSDMNLGNCSAVVFRYCDHKFTYNQTINR